MREKEKCNSMFNKYVLSGFFILLYKFSLDYIYVKIISPRYSYYGFSFDFNISKFIISLLVVIIMIFPMLVLINSNKSSNIIIYLLSIVYFIPGCTLYYLINLDNKYFLFFVLYWFLLVFTQLILPQIKDLSVKIKENIVIFNIIIFTFAIVVLFISGKYSGFRLYFSLKDVYNLRLGARELELPSIAEYILSSSYVILPLGTLYYILNNKKIMIIVLFFIQLLSFSFNGKKSVLFSMLVVIIIAKFYKNERKMWITPAFCGLNCLSIFESLFRNGISDIARLIHRRVFFTPPLLGAYYFEFFSKNGFDYLRQSVLRWFGFKSTYSIPLPRLIGLYYYNNIDTNANTGLVGDAFANFGWLGLFYPFLIILALRFFDKCSSRHDPKIQALMWVLLFYRFINGSFFTLMLSGGFIIACITLKYCPQNLTKKINRRDNNAYNKYYFE